MTDPTGAGWYDDANGQEADDKCAWAPLPFLGTGGYGYQFEWSNAAGACIASRPLGPAAPSLTVTSNSCFGSNDAAWTASSGATSYELWGSSSFTFVTQRLYYSGTNTFTTVKVSGTTYFHVRACNANGCGAYSNDDIATYTSGCQQVF